MENRKYYLGCPIWNKPEWKGILYPERAKANEYLNYYSQHLNSVEGNSTFYALPKKEQVPVWKKLTTDHFRFCFKFPQVITHQFKLVGTRKEVLEFLKRMSPLEEKLGRFMIQLPPSFDKSGLKTLFRFLNTLPKEYKYGVEVRHADFFIDQEVIFYLEQVLRKFDVERVSFDTTALHQLKSEEFSILAAQNKKPKVLERFEDLTLNPMIRFVGGNLIEEHRERLLGKIVLQTLKWIEKGKEPYIFIHSPDDLNTPIFCKLFDQALEEQVKGCNYEITPISDFSERLDVDQLSF